MILKICTRFSLHPRFYRYTYRDEFVSEAVARCLTHSLDGIKLDLPNCNPFSYITQTAYNVFRQKIKKEKKFTEFKNKIKNDLYDSYSKEGINWKKYMSETDSDLPNDETPDNNWKLFSRTL